MQLCRGTDNQEFAAVWFSYKWKLCVSLALQVPNSREVTCLKAVATYEEGLWISDPNVLLYLHLSQVPTLPSLLCTWKNDFFFLLSPFCFLGLFKKLLHSHKTSYIFFFLCFFTLHFQDIPLKENFARQGNKGSLLLLEEVKEPLSPWEMLTWIWSSLSSESGWVSFLVKQ